MVRTSANLANAIVKLAAVDALPALCGQLLVGNLVRRDFEPVLAEGGDLVNIPIPPVTNGGALGNAQIGLTTHVETTFQIPDVSKVIAIPDLLRLYMQPAIIAMAERVECDLLDLYGQFTANNPIGIGGTPLTAGAVESVETTLVDAGVSASEPKYLVTDGMTYSNLRNMPGFHEYPTAYDAGMRALIDGSVGRIKDLFVFRSQFVKKTGTWPMTANSLAFAKNAIGMAIRRLPKPLPGTGAICEYAELGNLGIRITMAYRPDTLAQQFTVDMRYGVGVLRNQDGVQVRS
ncbi:hypothetical protein [uncultured Paludibaculum sp.]|uniref:hypothetical protein n=1 Tax=uncultured Paludibaculum sp. TaxID=1765020 RepID=UPI002AAB85FF|nr:hypothetical protein [uncultured Paludibaculum sp.]